MPEGQQQSVEQRLKDSLQKANIDELKQEYVGTDDLDKLFCGGKPGSMVAAACESLEELNEGWPLEKNRVKLLWKQYKERLFEAVIQRIERQEKVSDYTRKKLENLAGQLEPHEELDILLQDSFRAGETLTQAIKLRKTPYKDKYQTEVGSEEDTIDMREMVALRQTMEHLNSLDTDELVDMIDEDQVYIDMLIEEHTDKPMEDAELDAAGQKHRLLDPKHKDYWEQVNHLVDFIQGKTEADKRAKSDFRKQAETTMWQEIVRGMDFNQKLDLVAQFIKTQGPEAARNFISKAIILKSMTRRDVEHMVKEAAEHPETHHGEQFAKLGGDMPEFLKVCVQAKDKMEREVSSYVEQVEKPQIQNAVQYFFTFDKILGETVARLGALTAILNIGVNIADGITSKGHAESWVTGAFRGVRSAMTDKFVIGGVAAAAVGSNVVYPWIKDAVYGPSSEERERLQHFREEELMQDQAANHHEGVDFLVDNYDAMLSIAEQNRADPKRNSFDLWRGDLKERFKITDALAQTWGYESADVAEAMVIRMFTACAKIFKTKHGTRLEDVNELVGFLSERGMYGEVHDHNQLEQHHK